MLFPLDPAQLFQEGRTRWIGAGVGVALLAAFNIALISTGQGLRLATSPEKGNAGCIRTPGSHDKGGTPQPLRVIA